MSARSNARKAKMLKGQGRVAWSDSRPEDAPRYLESDIPAGKKAAYVTREVLFDVLGGEKLTELQAKLLGVSLPPSNGWRMHLYERPIPIEDYRAFLATKRALAPVAVSPPQVSRGFIVIDRVVNPGLPPEQWRQEPTDAEWQAICEAAKKTHDGRR